MTPSSEGPGGSEQCQDDCTGDNFVHKTAVSKIDLKLWSKKAILTTFMSIQACRTRQHYSMLSLFSFQALEKLDLDVLDFWLFYRIVYFGVVFDLVFQICINSRTYVFSNSSRSLIEILAVFFSMRFFYIE